MTLFKQVSEDESTGLTLGISIIISFYALAITYQLQLRELRRFYEAQTLTEKAFQAIQIMNSHSDAILAVKAESLDAEIESA